MKLISVALARSARLIDPNELNPHGKNLFADLVPTLVKDYRFRTFPQEGGDLSQGMKFTGGIYTNKDGDVVDLDATIWSDAIGADTRSSTRDSDDFLAEMMEILPQLGFVYDPAMVRKQLYTSQLHVRCSKRLSALNPKLIDLGAQLSSVVGDDTSFEIAALELWAHPPTQVTKQVNFSFQRRLGDPPTGDRYWSQAPLPTEAHLQLLEELESVLS